MKFKAFLVRSWAYLSMALVTAVILFLFGYVFVQGGHVIT